jgi:L-amino acid N-acyltransferase YncA
MNSSQPTCNTMIRLATRSDAEEICEIYNYYVLNTHINFEEEAVTVKDMQDRIVTVAEKNPWLVYEENGKIIGYAYASEWKSRCAYRFSVETTVYLSHGLNRRGIGSMLYQELLTLLGEDKNIHAVIGGIALPNETSIRLHEKFGFEKVAHFKEVGFKFGKWIDVGYWEKILK